MNQNITSKRANDIIDNHQKIVKKDNIIYYLNEEEKTASIINNDSAHGNIYIPRSIIHEEQEFIITSISKNSFMESKTITSIQFPLDSELRSIEGEAFTKSSIESITIPSKLCELNDDWCAGTSKLTNVKVMPNNRYFVNLNDTMIIAKTDANKAEYDKIIFIRRDAKEVTIPTFITQIGSHAFSQSLIEKVFIPDQVKQINKGAFATCKNLQKVEIPENSELQIIDKYAFTCSGIKSLFIPKHVTHILTGAFSRCTNLQNIEVQENSELKMIDKYVFAQSSIKSLTIPSSICEFRKGWCAASPKLTKVTIMENHEQNTICYEGVMIVTKTDLKSNVFDDLIFVNRFIKTLTIPAFVSRISSFAASHSTVESIILNSETTRICECAFTFCKNLHHIEFPSDSKLQTIENCAFFETSIDSITIPSKLCELQNGWCAGTPKLTKVTIMPNNQYFMNIDDQIIVGKTNICDDEYDKLIFSRRDIKVITIPKFIKRIGSHAFSYSSITSICIPNHIIQICDGAFFFTKHLHRVDFQENSELQEIGNTAFLGSSISSIIIPPHVTKIEENAFTCCHNLQIIEIDENSEMKSINIQKSKQVLNTIIMMPAKLKELI